MQFKKLATYVQIATYATYTCSVTLIAINVICSELANCYNLESYLRMLQYYIDLQGTAIANMIVPRKRRLAILSLCP